MIYHTLYNGYSIRYFHQLLLVRKCGLNFTLAITFLFLSALFLSHFFFFFLLSLYYFLRFTMLLVMCFVLLFSFDNVAWYVNVCVECIRLLLLLLLLFFLPTNGYAVLYAWFSFPFVMDRVYYKNMLNHLFYSVWWNVSSLFFSLVFLFKFQMQKCMSRTPPFNWNLNVFALSLYIILSLLFYIPIYLDVVWFHQQRAHSNCMYILFVDEQFLCRGSVLNWKATHSKRIQ